jgi:hypothetical protein
MRNHQSRQRLVPITALRHLYKLLRCFPNREFHLAVAKEFNRLPNKVSKLVAESREHFALYDNRGEAFHNRNKPLTEALKANRKLANTLVQRFAALGEKSVNVSSAKNFNFQYVDYEISPFRTTKSTFDNGGSGKRTGTGGMDLLLINSNDQTPIVGEIKADTDVNPFLGLIQCLMYAVELSTESQRARLNQFYPERFADGTSAPGIDIYLFLLRYPQKQVSKEFLTLTDRLSASLMADNMPGLGFIRRIVALENPMSESSSNSFSVAFAHEHDRH